MKFQDSSFNDLKVTVGTKSVTHPRTHPPTHAPKAICPINFFKVGGIKIPFLKQQKVVNGHKNIFMIKSQRKNEAVRLAEPGLEPQP